MLFDTPAFAGFFAVFFLLYYLARDSLRVRNGLILLGSAVFYGAWSVQFLLLLVTTASFDFFAALHIAASDRQRARLWAVASLSLNIVVLGFFKYCNFFVDSFRDLLALGGVQINTATLDIVLPVGISFYTFQSMSYVIDVYRGRIAPSSNLVEFLAYISFFPQLVAGPIERAGSLLPQFQTERPITAQHLKDGMTLTIVGLFKKIVIADNLAEFVQLAYGHPDPGAGLVIAGTTAFAFQIYCDFSGYSDIARGTAALLGFKLMKNFDLPYLAASLREFWRRWHISLSSWFRDYLYLPLGGNRRGLWRTCSNLFIVMLVAGLWHGAKITFVLWGAWHALGLISNKLWLVVKPVWMRIPSAVGWILTMTWILYGWLIFRASSIEDVYRLTAALTNFSTPVWFHLYLRNLAVLCVPLLLYQIWQRTRGSEFPLLSATWSRAFVHAFLIIAILVFGQREEVRPFIYFQF
jgi:alginate O-acetyltransferase complex protein AlgI